METLGDKWKDVMRKRLANLLGAISPSCRDSVRLMARSRAQPIGFGYRLGLWIHLVLCSFCRRYQRQIEFLRTSLDPEPSGPAPGLPVEARQRIRERLGRASAAGLDDPDTGHHECRHG